RDRTDGLCGFPASAQKSRKKILASSFWLLASDFFPKLFHPPHETAHDIRVLSGHVVALGRVDFEVVELRHGGSLLRGCRNLPGLGRRRNHAQLPATHANRLELGSQEVEELLPWRGPLP